METRTAREDAERWMDVAGKLLEARDLQGSKRSASKAQETDPTVDGVDQITAIVDVLLAAEKRINNHLDWYAILQLDRRSNDLELIRRQYRKLTLLLHPDKNKSPFSAHAFKFVCDAWAFLSDSTKKSLYDNEFNMFMRFDPIVLNKQQAVRRSYREKRKTAKATAAALDATDDDDEVVEVQMPPQSQSQSHSHSQSRLSTFWTICPYCYHLYEYPKVYEDCCLRCQKCRRSFHAVVIPSPPPAVGHGKEMYYCCWAIFPIGFTAPEYLAENPNSSPFNSMFSKKAEVDNAGVEEKSHGRKKARTENADDTSSVRVDTEKQSEGSGKKYQGVNVPNQGVQNGSGTKTVEPQKTVRVKTTARKSIKPKPINKPVEEAQDKINGGKLHSELVGINLNMEVKQGAEEPKVAPCAVEGLVFKSADNQATEGIGFFEGLDDILGNLPMLAVPGEQKAQTSS